MLQSLRGLAEDTLIGTPLETLARRVIAFRNPRAQQSLEYDRLTKQIMQRVLSQDSNCIDIGAHRGSVLISMVRLAPMGQHFAFEPLPGLAQRLHRRFPQVSISALALSDMAGEREFCHIVTSPGLSGFHRMPTVPRQAVVKLISVRTARLDDVLPPDIPFRFIKIDVEGAQLEVLKGAVETIRRLHPFIVFEHGMMTRDIYGTTSEAVFDLLVDGCGLQISLLRNWLTGALPHSREEFCAAVGYHAGSEFCFLAHPDSAERLANY